MFYNYYHQQNTDAYNECTARGICSIAPNISSLQEVLLIYIKQIAFYALKFNEFNMSAKKLEKTVIEGLASLITTTDYSDEQFLNSVSSLHSILSSAKEKYKDYCKNYNLECEDLKFTLKITPQMTLSQIITQGEKSLLARYKKISTEKKNLTDILLSVIKSMCGNLMILEDLGERNEQAVNLVLTGINAINFSRTRSKNYGKLIDELVEVDNELLFTIYDLQVAQFGEMQKITVSHSTTPGKAILVSGSSLENLQGILEATQGEDIDIYTHGDLLIAHAFSNFNDYENLRGHYGTCIENCIFDFATFPGAILLTKNFNQNIEFLYRGRLFTTEKMQPQGVVKLSNGDYTKLVESAKSAKGFAKGKEKPSETVGFSKKYLDKKIKEIGEKFNNNEIEHLFIVGSSSFASYNEDYFKKLYKILPEKSYMISFSEIIEADNVLQINIVNNLAIIYHILKQLFDYIPSNSEKIAFFLTRCDMTAISNMISLKRRGVKNIFLSNCSAKSVNPSVLKVLNQDYHINSLSTPEDDLKKILNNGK